jgi:hypothetical protein
MHRRKRGRRAPEDFFFLSDGLPWQAGVALALAIILVVHAMAAREPITAAAVQDVGTVATHGIVKALAALGHYIVPLVLLGGAAASLFGGRRRQKAATSKKPAAEDPAASAPSDAAHAAASACPACGGPMVRRRARRGTHAEQEFYGCSRYPVCQETRPV